MVHSGFVFTVHWKLLTVHTSVLVTVPGVSEGLLLCPLEQIPHGGYTLASAPDQMLKLMPDIFILDHMPPGCQFRHRVKLFGYCLPEKFRYGERIIYVGVSSVGFRRYYPSHTHPSDLRFQRITLWSLFVTLHF